MVALRRSWNWVLALLVLIPLGQDAGARESFHFTESSANADQSDWLGIDEGQVFFRMLRHQGEGQAWTIKIGKGGQIYSIKTPELGELIARQREKHGQWVDEVFQHVFDMPPQKEKNGENTIVDGDIHQAGYYTWSDLDRNEQVIKKSVYSPLFAYRHDPDAKAVSFITWPQHAHLPRRYAENLLLIEQRITDQGDGVVEISGEVSKWGGARNDLVDLPWSAFRTATLPVQVISGPGGGYRVQPQVLREKDRDKITWIRDGNTGGWVALAASEAVTARGIGIVYGKQPRDADGPKSRVRWGTYSNPKRPEHDGTVIAVYRQVGLEPGDTLLFRYFLVLGTLEAIQAKGDALESQVLLQKVRRQAGDARVAPVCLDSAQGLRRDCDAGQAVAFRSFRDFIPGARPLFLLRKARTAELLLTDDPYELSFDPTDGTSIYLDLLGWAIAEGQAGQTCGSRPLGEAVAGTTPRVALGRRTGELRVLTADTAACAPVGAGPPPGE